VFSNTRARIGFPMTTVGPRRRWAQVWQDASNGKGICLMAVKSDEKGWDIHEQLKHALE
jgi:hypothetical protein